MWDESWEGQDTLRRGAAAGRESKAAPISLERVAPQLKDGWGLRRSGGCGGEEHAYNCASNMRGLRQRDVEGPCGRHSRRPWHTDGGHNNGLKSRENEVSPAPDEESFTAQSMVQVDTFNTIVRNAMAPSR